MKKLYLGISLLLFLLLFSVGICSVAAAGIPSIGINSLAQKEYALQFQKHLYKYFPGKEPLQELSTQMNGFYKYTGFSEQGSVQLLIPITNDAADHGAALPQKPEEKPQESTYPVPTNPTETEQEVPETEVAAPTEDPGNSISTEPHIEEPPVEVLGQILLMGDRAIELPIAKYEAIESYADAVSDIASALDGVNTYSIIVPNAAGLYAPEAYQSGKDSQKAMIDYAYGHMSSNVTTIDAYSILQDHMDEYLYFRTDHHWTHLGSYYAYTALCDEIGLIAQPLFKFKTGKYDSFLGTMYSFLSEYPQRQILKDNPDTLTYYIPTADTGARYYESADLSYGGKIDVIYPLSEKRSNKYLCFLGGDHPITILETGFTGGKTCILIKESYGNAFSTWLTSHYSKIICIDPREFNRTGKPSLDLIEFAARMNADDCIILNYPIMINSSAYSSWLGRMVNE